MRGTPFLQAILVVAVFLLAGLPVYRLTRPAAPAAGGSAPEIAADRTKITTSPLQVEVLCASAPAEFQVKCLDQIVLTGRAPQARFSKLWTTAIPPEGLDLVIHARWPTDPAAGNPTPADAASGANPGAARVSVRLADGRQIEKSFWADANGTVSEVFTVPGQAVETAP